MMDRKIAPEIRTVENIDFIEPKKTVVNNVPFYLMDKGVDETVRIEFYFDGGKINGGDGISSFTNGLLLAGTIDHTAIEIQEKINSLGGFYETGVGLENSVITLYCLKEFAVQICEVLTDAIYNASFPKKEVDEYLTDKLQQHLISLEKVNMLA